MTYKASEQVPMVSCNGTSVNRLLKSTEHRNVLVHSRLEFWIKLAKVKELLTQVKEFFTQFKP